MDVRKISEMIGGWFIGGFEPSVWKTDLFEVCYKVHQQGEVWPKHTHHIQTEINYLIRGKMTIQGQLLTQGDIFTLHPHEIADPEFLETCELIVVKVPYVKGDKYEV